MLNVKSSSLIAIIILLILIIFLAISVQGYSVVVSPKCSNNVENCSNSSHCENGDQNRTCTLIDQALEILTTGMTLFLEPGLHIIRDIHDVLLSGLSNVSLIGENKQVNITCLQGRGLAFVNLTTLYVTNVTITGCGLYNDSLNRAIRSLKEIVDVWFYIPSTVRIAVVLGHCENVIFDSVEITNTNGIGLLGVNVIGNSEMIAVNITRNIRPKCITDMPVYPFEIQPIIFDQIGGGAYFLYQDYISNVNYNLSQASNLQFSDSTFTYNAECSFAAITEINYQYFFEHAENAYMIGAGGGLSVILAQESFPVNFTVMSSLFYKNEARYGGGAHVSIFAGSQHYNQVTFSNCIFLENGMASNVLGLVDSVCDGGAGLAIFTDMIKFEHFQRPVQVTNGNAVIMVNAGTRFTRNRANIQGGGVVAYSHFNTPHRLLNNNHIDYRSINWIFSDTIFEENSARFGSAAFFTQNVEHGVDGLVLLTLQNVCVMNNKENVREYEQHIKRETSSAIHIRKTVMIVNEWLNFTSNDMTALHIESAIFAVYPQASVRFKGNRGYRGGALYFEGHSPAVILHPNSTLSFIENSAIVEGGAIYYASKEADSQLLQPLNYSDCFIGTPELYLIETPETFNIFTSGILIEFSGNSGPYGSIIYGSSLESCKWAENITKSEGNLYEVLFNDYNETFKSHQIPLTTKMFGGPPSSIQVSHNTNETGQMFELFPGQSVEVNITVRDNFDNVVPAIVTSGTRDDNVTVTLADSGFWYTVKNTTHLRVNGLQEEQLNVSIFTSSNFVHTDIGIELFACPAGFIFENSTQSCKCDPLILNSKYTDRLECHSTFINFTSLDKYWIGTDLRSDKTTSDLIVHGCILDYCRPGNKLVVPSKYDSQCRKDSFRTGILCGSCLNGYSSVFGNNDCKVCSNNYLVLIPVLAIAGVLLFVSIACLEITMDKGWTNLAFFYCNAVSIYTYIVSSNYFAIHLLFVPARLLSLQIGIGLCFFDGMDALQRTVLQFAFPGYLYFLMGIFFLLCRRFSWMSKHFCPAKTLSTLGLLTYISVMSTCIDALGGTITSTVGGEVSFRWNIDPNFKYFHGLHALLAFVAIVILLVYIIPLSLILLFPSLAYKHFKKFKPFYDIWWAPFKEKYRWWLGFRLIIRALLFTSTAFPYSISFAISGLIILSALYIQMCIQPFKKKWMNNVDSFLIGNVAFVYWGALNTLTYVPTKQTLAYEILYAAITLGTGYTIIVVVLIIYIKKFIETNANKIRISNVNVDVITIESNISTRPTNISLNNDISSTSIVGERHSPTRCPNNVADYSQYRDSILETVD